MRSTQIDWEYESTFVLLGDGVYRVSYATDTDGFTTCYNGNGYLYSEDESPLSSYESAKDACQEHKENLAKIGGISEAQSKYNESVVDEGVMPWGTAPKTILIGG